MAAHLAAGEPQLGRVALDDVEQREAEHRARVRVRARPHRARRGRARAPVGAEPAALHALAGEHERAARRRDERLAARDRLAVGATRSPRRPAARPRRRSAPPRSPAPRRARRARRSRCASVAARPRRPSHSASTTNADARAAVHAPCTIGRAHAGEPRGEDAAMQRVVVAADAREGVHARGRDVLRLGERRARPRLAGAGAVAERRARARQGAAGARGGAGVATRGDGAASAIERVLGVEPRRAVGLRPRVGRASARRSRGRGQSIVPAGSPSRSTRPRALHAASPSRGSSVVHSTSTTHAVAGLQAARRPATAARRASRASAAVASSSSARCVSCAKRRRSVTGATPSVVSVDLDRRELAALARKPRAARQPRRASRPRRRARRRARGRRRARPARGGHAGARHHRRGRVCTSWASRAANGAHDRIAATRRPGERQREVEAGAVVRGAGRRAVRAREAGRARPPSSTTGIERMLRARPRPARRARGARSPRVPASPSTATNAPAPAARQRVTSSARGVVVWTARMQTTTPVERRHRRRHDDLVAARRDLQPLARRARRQHLDRARAGRASSSRARTSSPGTTMRHSGLGRERRPPSSATSSDGAAHSAATGPSRPAIAAASGGGTGPGSASRSRRDRRAPPPPARARSPPPRSARAARRRARRRARSPSASAGRG